MFWLASITQVIDHKNNVSVNQFYNGYIFLPFTTPNKPNCVQLTRPVLVTTTTLTFC
jgi:hypothetical protein